jgi:hypothetical protein
MVERACPENSVLLPDLLPKQPEPWTVCRQIAIYVVFSEQLGSGSESPIRQLAEDVKAWLQRRCDLEPDHVVLCTDQDSRDINEATSADCDVVATQTDTVLLLQSAQVLAEPRCLARLYSASTNRVPIVPVLLTGTAGDTADGSVDQRKFDQWNFEQAKSTFSELGAHLSSPSIASLEQATGVATAAVGSELLQTIPNVISKPLSVGGTDTEFEAQMCDIELTLRREMATVGKTIKRTTLDTAITKNQSHGTEKPRTVARVVARARTPPRQTKPPSESVPPEP